MTDIMVPNWTKIVGARSTQIPLHQSIDLSFVMFPYAVIDLKKCLGTHYLNEFKSTDDLDQPQKVKISIVGKEHSGPTIKAVPFTTCSLLYYIIYIKSSLLFGDCHPNTGSHPFLILADSDVLGHKLPSASLSYDDTLVEMCSREEDSAVVLMRSLYPCPV